MLVQHVAYPPSVELDTHDPRRTTPVAAGDPVTVGPRSLTVLRAPR